MEPNKELFEKIIKHQRRCSSSVFVDFWPNFSFFYQFLSKSLPFLPQNRMINKYFSHERPEFGCSPVWKIKRLEK